MKLRRAERERLWAIKRARIGPPRLTLAKSRHRYLMALKTLWHAVSAHLAEWQATNVRPAPITDALEHANEAERAYIKAGGIPV